MLLTGAKRHEFRMTDDYARGHAGVSGYCLVPGIARHYAGVWLAHYLCQYQHRGRVAVPAGELCQARSIAINNRSRRDTVDESSLVKTFVRERAGERRRTGGDYLRHAHPAALDRAHKFQQAIVTGMRRFCTFGLVQPAILTVIVVQPTEFQTCIFNCPYDPNHLFRVSLFDSGAIHAGIYVDEDADRGASPLPHLFFVLGQYRNANVRELICDFAQPPRIRAYHRIGEKHICRAAAAGHQQFECGRALEIADTSLDQHAESVGQLCGLDVRAPAIRIAAEQMQGPRHIRGNDFRIYDERRSKDTFDARHPVTFVPGKFAQHGLMRCHRL